MLLAENREKLTWFWVIDGDDGALLILMDVDRQRKCTWMTKVLCNDRLMNFRTIIISRDRRFVQTFPETVKDAQRAYCDLIQLYVIEHCLPNELM